MNSLASIDAAGLGARGDKAVGGVGNPPVSTSDSLEEWRPVVGYEGRYSVSSQGVVRSERTGQPISVSLADRGYPSVTLYRSGEQVKRRVHRIVGESFLGPRPAGLVTRHLNDIKTDNRVANLAYGTPRENELDKIANGHNPLVTSNACKQGHEYTEANVYWRTRPGLRPSRSCRTCSENRRAKWRAAAATTTSDGEAGDPPVRLPARH